MASRADQPAVTKSASVRPLSTKKVPISCDRGTSPFSVASSSFRWVGSSVLSSFSASSAMAPSIHELAQEGAEIVHEDAHHHADHDEQHEHAAEDRSRHGEEEDL